jgi:polysaccharide chain length determinant protein (PEP-CTERM system associated)
MANLDFKFYLAVFVRRLPYFLVIAALVSAVGITVASILPPVYRSSASMLVERQQIPGELAQSTVPVNTYEQVQIIQQRLLTRDNLIALADRIGLYADQPEMSAGAMVSDIRKRIQFIGFEPDVTQERGLPGAMIIGVAFEAPEPHFAHKGANELVNLVLQENVRLRTDRATGTVAFFETEVERLAEAIERQSERISEFQTANVEALPDSLGTRRAQQQREQERLLTLEREEAALRNQRATSVWVYERTGRATLAGPLSPEEEELQALKSQLIQQRAVYAPDSPRVRTLETRIAALERLVEEQRAARAVPDAEGNPTEPMTELELELAPIDARLEFIQQEKALIQETLAALDASIRATPANEMVLGGLQRELDTLQTQYNEAVAARSQAATGERIEVMSKGERFTLLDPPTEPGSPVRPQRVLIAGAGVFGGVGLGMAFVLLLELLNRSIRRPVDLTTGLGLQPFVTVPYIQTHAERGWKRGVLLAMLAVVALAIPAALWALHTFYLPLDLLWSQLLETVGIGAGVEGGSPVPATE